MKRFCLILVLVAVVIGATATGQTPKASRTQVILLGTGAAAMDPERSGPATLVIVDDRAYLIDIGPGVVRRAAAAAAKGTKAAAPSNIKVAFVTHLHHDHTVGYPDLILTPWVVARKDELNVYGPPGLKGMTMHILKAWKEMIAISTRGLEQNEPLRLKVHEIRPGVVYKDNLVRVTAFSVHHGEWKHAFGYRFDTPDRTIVISGDTRPGAELVDACHRCDILIHEAYSPLSKAGLPDWPKYRSLYHTSTTELAGIAKQTQPGLLIIYHRTGARTQIPDEQYLNEIHQGYSGNVVIGHDLEVY